MQSFTYIAREGQDGPQIRADIDAENEARAAQLLIARGLTPIEITPKKTRKGFNYFVKRQLTKQRVIFSRQLATLVNAGLPLVQSLHAVHEQTTHKGFKQVIETIINDVEAGIAFSESLGRYPDLFDEVYINLIAAGEQSGTLDKSLNRLADKEEADTEILAKIRGALIYPIIVLLVLIAVVIFMMTTVLPQVQSLYDSLPGVSLPFLTVWLLKVSGFIVAFWWLIIIVLGIGIYGFIRWSRTAAGKLAIDKFRMHAWGIGPMYMRLYMAQFARTAATLVASGIPMIKMLNTTASAVDNVHIQNSIHRATEEVKGGKNLSEALKNDKNFLDLVPNMISIGEQSGQLDNMLEKLADYYEKQVDAQVKSISTIVEPILMIVVGVIAMIIVAAVLLPIYSLAGKNLVG